MAEREIEGPQLGAWYLHSVPMAPSRWITDEDEVALDAIIVGVAARLG